MSPLQVLYPESILPPTRAYSLLFCAPDMPKWRDALDSNEVSGRIVLIVVDEAPFMACTAIASGLFRTGTLSCSVR